MNNKKNRLISTFCFPICRPFSTWFACCSPFRETQQNNYAYDLIILHQLIRFAICFAVNVWLHFLLIESKWIPVVHGFRWSSLQVPYWYSTGMRKEPAHGPASRDRETNSTFKLINWWVLEIMWWILVDKCCHLVDLMWHYRRCTCKPVKPHWLDWLENIRM